MIIHRSQLRAVHAAASDDTGYFLNGIAILPDGRVAATNGHVAIVISRPDDGTKESDYPDTTGTIADTPAAEQTTLIPTPEVNRMIGAMKGKQGIPILEWAHVKPTNGESGLMLYNSLSSVVTVKASEPDVRFPEIDRIVPANTKTSKASIQFDARLMRDICDAAVKWNADGCKRSFVPVTFRVYDEVSAMRMDATSPNGSTFLAVIMPMGA